VDPQQKAKALEDYEAACILLHAAVLINFTKDEDEAFEVACDLSYGLVKRRGDCKGLLGYGNTGRNLGGDEQTQPRLLCYRNSAIQHQTLYGV